MTKKIIQIVVALLVVGLGLYLALRNVDLAQVARELQQAAWGWILLCALFVFLTLPIRAQRWRILMGRHHSLRDAVGLIGVGYLLSGILPLRLGDPGRAVAASLRGPVSAMGALSTVVIERALDMLVIVLLLIATLPFVPGLQTYLETVNVGVFSSDVLLGLSGGASFVLLVLFIGVALYPGKVEALAEAMLRRLRIPHPDRWLQPIRSVLDGLAALRSGRESLAIMAWTLLLWLTTATYFAVGLRAFSPEASLLKGTVATWSSAFGMIFPAPGGIGAFHYAVSQSLQLGFGLPPEVTVAYATVVHGIAYVWGIVVGALALLIWGISFKELGLQSQQLEQESAPPQA